MTPRLPCHTGVDYTGPLVNVDYPVGASTKPFCVGGVFTSDVDSAQYHVGNNAANPALATDVILKNQNIAGQFLVAGDNPVYFEWYPQAFAIQANPDDGVGSVYADQSRRIDQVASNGYFTCTANRTNGWLHWVYTGQTTPPTAMQLPAGCQ